MEHCKPCKGDQVPQDPLISLRAATAKDASAVRSLTRQAYAKWLPMIGREPMPMTADHEAAIRNHRVDLLHVDGELAGVIEMIPKDDHVVIENVAVSPSHQGKGLGRMLLGHAERLAASSGHAEIRLYTNKLFDQNIRLYERLGYVTNCEDTWSGGIIVHMRKAVGAGSLLACLGQDGT